MRMKFHSDKIPGQGKYGAYIFECEPQQRSILCYTGGVQRVSFPWMYFAIKYTVSAKSYGFGGVYANGLGVYFRNEQLQTFNDALYHSPTDVGRNGIVCTDHRFDALTCKTSEEIAGTVLDIWWNTPHYILWPDKSSQYGYDYDYAKGMKAWVKETPESVLKKNWTPIGGTFQTLLPLSNDEPVQDLPVPKLTSCFFKNVGMV